MVYKWRGGNSLGVPAQIAGERLEQLRAANNGSVDPRIVVNDARPEDSPLHAAFLWDDSAAAEKFRIDQARKLVRSLVQIDRHGGEISTPTRSYVSVGTPKTGPSYIPSFVAMSDREMRNKVLADAIKQLSAFRERFGHLEELAALWPVIENVQEEQVA